MTKLQLLSVLMLIIFSGCENKEPHKCPTYTPLFEHRLYYSDSDTIMVRTIKSDFLNIPETRILVSDANKSIFPYTRWYIQEMGSFDNQEFVYVSSTYTEKTPYIKNYKTRQ